MSSAHFDTKSGCAAELKQNLFDSADATMEDWTSVYATNVASAFFLTTAMLPLLQKLSERHPH